MITALLTAAAAAQAAPPVMPNAPPIVAIPRDTRMDGRPARSIVMLSEPARGKVEALGKVADALGDSAWKAKDGVLQDWRRALAGPTFDPKAITATASAMDRVAERDGIFARWAALFLSLSADDRDILAPYLARGKPRLFELDAPTAPPPPRSVPVPPSPAEIARRKAMNDFLATMMNAVPDGRMTALGIERERIMVALPDLAQREPFDAEKLKKAYASYALVRGQIEARRNELVIDHLARLPADQRRLVIAQIPYLSTPKVVAPFAPPKP